MAKRGFWVFLWSVSVVLIVGQFVLVWTLADERDTWKAIALSAIQTPVSSRISAMVPVDQVRTLEFGPGFEVYLPPSGGERIRSDRFQAPWELTYRTDGTKGRFDWVEAQP